MDDVNRIHDLLEAGGWTMQRQGKGTHEVWHCPPECGQHIVSVPARASHAGFSKGSPLVRRIARCAKDLQAKQAQASALQSVLQGTPPAAPEPDRQPEPTPPPAPEPEPAPEPAQDGPLEVIAREPALATHPHFPDKTYPLENGWQLLLSDGTVVYECGTDTCRAQFGSANSLRSHLATRSNPDHSAGYRTRTTDPRVIKALLAGVRAALQQGASLSKACQLTAVELNRQGYKTVRGKPWGSDSVVGIYRTHKERDEMQPRPAPPRIAAPRPADVPAEIQQGARQARREQYAELVREMDIDDAAWMMVQLARRVDDFSRGREQELKEAFAAGAATVAPDPVIAEKAAKWDQMSALMRG